MRGLLLGSLVTMLAFGVAWGWIDRTVRPVVGNVVVVRIEVRIVGSTGHKNS